MNQKPEYNVTTKVRHGFTVREYVPKRTPEEEKSFSQKVTMIVYHALRQHGRVP